MANMTASNTLIERAIEACLQCVHWWPAYIVARQEGKTPEEVAKEGKLYIEGALAA